MQTGLDSDRGRDLAFHKQLLLKGKIMTPLVVVSGSYRFQPFSNACVLPSPSTLGSLPNEGTAAISQIKEFTENSAQTEPSCSHIRKEEKKPPARIEKLRFESRGGETRRKTEIAMPKIMDEKSIEEYKRLLEENEKRHLFLREKEMDEMIEEKLLEIKKDLERRYPKANNIKEVESNDNPVSMQDKIVKTKEDPPKPLQTPKQHTKKHVENVRIQSRRNPNNFHRIEPSGRKIQEQRRCLELVESCF